MTAPLNHPGLGLRTVDPADPTEAPRLTAYVEAHPQATPFHLPAWLNAVAKGCSQRSHVLVAEHGDGRLAGMLPLSEIRSPLFGNALVSSGFGVDGGILADNATAIRLLGDAVVSLAGELHCPSIELRGGPSPGDGWHGREDTYIGFARPLAEDDDAELLAVPRKQRAEVRRALKNETLEVAVGRDAAIAAEHYAVYAESVRNLGTPVFPPQLFTSVLKAFGEAADILVVRDSGVAVAGVLSLYWRNCVYPYWGGGTAAARSLRANDRMYFALMGHARARGCTRFDFGRSKVGTGAAAFKKNWGFAATPLSYHVRALDGAAPREINPLSPKYRLQVAVWRKLPLWVANRLGPVIAKGLG